MTILIKLISGVYHVLQLCCYSRILKPEQTSQHQCFLNSSLELISICHVIYLLRYSKQARLLCSERVA